MKNKILITGATGGLGSKVISLLKEKTEVENLAVLVRDEKNELTQQYANDGIEVKIGDYADLESLKNAFKVLICYTLFREETIISVQNFIKT